ncbi:hypothetical protein XM38_045700 [Halomicronema hongdechloris C2206]|uniref:Internalin-A n=1 Tax=Halomicronema hongdechloris C2206 TaxID=1641165 RepID=A0A1Z3HTH3_9CYAN|nr:leucine-rich repeat domain-containing protein [Halomicronema hongdechloris]ASC73599.1 hypothetical protein XM38_045700 [Halomicronema hongdechloris C2206]
MRLGLRLGQCSHGSIRDCLGTIDSPEPAQVSTLDLRRQQLRDLSGIERFPNLRVLHLDHNQIDTVAGLTALQQLQILFLGGNNRIPESQLQRLSALNIADFRRPDWKTQ